MNDINDGDWNEDIYADVKPTNLSAVSVASRDWTVETIVSQINKGNIDLNPKFQRRNAWKDDKRSRLIESLILGIPVPEIVLAEDRNKKNSFIVIDGKQRLLTIAGFIYPDSFQYWQKPRLTKLHVRKDLNSKVYRQFEDSKFDLGDELRAFQNADIRCTVISNYNNDDVLYDIFYRLNTGSVPLSTQELRQVLNKGPFADWLMEITNELQPIHPILNLDEPDPRLKDIEVIFRFLAISLFGADYTGNLKKFLDDSMKKITDNWDQYHQKVVDSYGRFNKSLEALTKVLEAKKIGRKFTDNRWDSIFNKALFEVEAYYFMHVDAKEVANKKAQFVQAFKEFSSKNTEFRKSIEVGTNALESYRNRFSLFQKFMNTALDMKIRKNPLAETTTNNK